MADIDENVVVEEVNEEPVDPRPELILEVPEAAEGIDVSEWCSNTKRILGKQYKVIFIDKREE